MRQIFALACPPRSIQEPRHGLRWGAGLVLALALGSGREVSGQIELMRVQGTFAGGSQFISSALGDVDGDDIADFAIGSPTDHSFGPLSGRVEFRSGRNGAVLRVLFGSVGSYFGCSLAAPGDVDRDGVPDLAVGGLGTTASGRREAGRVSIHSGRTGLVLREWIGLQASDWFGVVLDVAGDVNNDGQLDLIAGAPQNADPLSGYEQGYVLVMNPRTGGVLHHFIGTRTGDEFGSAVAGCGDIDLDGHDDVIIGAPLETLLGDRGGCARVFSGRTGLVLHSFTGRRGSDHFGIGVAGAGDVDVDGMLDLIVGGIDLIYPHLPGEARLFSGRDGRLLKVIRGVVPGSMTGRWVGTIGDFDHDGASDVWIGSPMEVAGRGAVRIHSGRNGALLHTLLGSGGGFGAYGRSVGDLDGDGYEEYGFGAPGEGRAGAVHIFSVAPTSPFGLGCSSRQREPELTTSAAQLGGVCTARIATRRSGLPVTLLVGSIPFLPLQISGECTLYVDPTRDIISLPLTSGGGGATSLAIPVVADPLLIGVSLALQALVLDGASLDLTNAGLLTIAR